jgi:hypothetical protein
MLCISLIDLHLGMLIIQVPWSAIILNIVDNLQFVPLLEDKQRFKCGGLIIVMLILIFTIISVQFLSL